MSEALTARTNLRSTDAEKMKWERAAGSDDRKLTPWCRLVLNIVSDSGLSSASLRQALHDFNSRKTC